MSRFGRCACLLSILVSTHAWSAPNDPYKITAKEKAACTADAIRYCSHTYPDAGQLLACMRSNRNSLSAVCLAAFDAGLKRRHMN